MSKIKSFVDVRIEKKPNAFIFSFKISANLEAIYKSRSEAVLNSENWKGLSFYSMPKILQNSRYNQLLADHKLFDNYGSEIYMNGKFNIAFLRTIGGTGSIIFNQELPFYEVSELMRNLKSVMGEIYSEFFQGYKIKTRFSIEV